MGMMGICEKMLIRSPVAVKAVEFELKYMHNNTATTSVDAVRC